MPHVTTTHCTHRHRYTSDSRFSLGSLLPLGLPTPTVPPPECRHAAGCMAQSLAPGTSLTVQHRSCTGASVQDAGQSASGGEEHKGVDPGAADSGASVDAPWSLSNPEVRKWVPRALLHGVLPAGLLDLPLRWWRTSTRSRFLRHSGVVPDSDQATYDL